MNIKDEGSATLALKTSRVIFMRGHPHAMEVFAYLFYGRLTLYILPQT